MPDTLGRDDRPAAFISYSHLDRTFALRLGDALGRSGKDTWLDENEIRGGAELAHALKLNMRAELAHALKLNMPILPLGVIETPLDALPHEVGYAHRPRRWDSVRPLPGVICGGFPRMLALAQQRETRGFTAEERSLLQTG